MFLLKEYNMMINGEKQCKIMLPDYYDQKQRDLVRKDIAKKLRVPSHYIRFRPVIQQSERSTANGTIT